MMKGVRTKFKQQVNLIISLLAKISFFLNNWLIGAYSSLNNAPQLVPGINNCGDLETLCVQ